MIERDNGIPYYRQLMEIIQRQIDAGALPEGTRIPSEFALSDAFRVNRHTVRQAVGELCRLGVLYKARGRGTFVSKRRLDCLEYKVSPKNRFTETIMQAGKIPGSRVLQAVQVPAPPYVAAQLALPAEETVYLLEILRLVNEQPFLVASTFLPVRHFPGFLAHLQPFTSLFAIYSQFYAIRPRRVKSIFRASFPNQEQAVALQIPANMPVLKVESVLKSQDDILIQYNVSCYRGDLAKVSVDW